jgi:O-succinylbenzoic acid--CoA ligase
VEKMRDWLAHRAHSTPAAMAVEAGDQSLTYRELDERCEECAGRLASLGVGVEDHLGVLAKTGLAFVELAHAAMRLGAVLVPLNTRLTADEVADRVEHADLSLLVCTGATEGTARAALRGTDVPLVTTGPGGDVPALSRLQPETYDVPAWDRDCPQVVMFTSGTTGEPKAVLLTMGNLLASAMASAFRLGVRPDDRWFDGLPMYHMGGLAPIYRSVLYGTTLVVGEAFDPEATLAAMHETRPTCVSLVPTMLQRLLDAGDLPESLRVVLLGGAAAPDDLVRKCGERGVPVCPTYGMTEAASQIATALPEEALENVGTVGAPLMFTDLHVVDENGRECDADEVGELVVSGPTVTPGYYRDPAATAAAFSSLGFHTGDSGYRDEDGRLFVMQRLDDRIVTGGENVDPEEVVAALRAHPAITEAAVVGVPDEEWGERVAALVVGDISREELAAHCRGRLAGFKRPRIVAFVDELPRTASGTIDREAVRDRLVGARV